MDLEQFAAEVVGIPVPFKEQGRDRAGWDCWGIIVCAYREVYGIELPDLGEYYDHARGSRRSLRPCAASSLSTGGRLKSPSQVTW